MLSHLKVIPQIDKYPALIRFAQHPAGKFVILGVFIGLFFLYYPSLFIPTAVVLTALTLFPTRRPLVLVLGNLFYLLTSGLMFTHLRHHSASAQEWSLLEELSHHGLVFDASMVTSIGFQVLVAAAIMALFCLYLKAAGSIRAVAAHPVISLTIAIIALLLLTERLSSWPLLCVFCWVVLNWITRAYSYLAYTAADQKLIQQKSLFLKAGTFLPFWNGGSWAAVSVVPRGYRGIESTAAKNAEELAVCQLSAIKLMLWSLLLQVFADIISVTVFNEQPAYLFVNLPSLHLANVTAIGVRQFAALNIPVYQKWIAVWVDTFNLLLSIAASTGCIVAIVRMCGFNVFRNVYRPHQARDFNDFLGRIYFYYIDVVVKFYFFPMSRYTRFMSGAKNVRIFLTVFLSMMLAGVTLNYMRGFPDMVILGFRGSLLLSLARLPYFLLLGVFVGISSLASRGRSRAEPGYWRRFATSVMCFFIYSFCWTLQLGYRDASLHDRMAFFLSLFGVK